MSRKRNRGSENPNSTEDSKDKGTKKTNSLCLQTPANDDEWEVALHPSRFIASPGPINDDNIPTKSEIHSEEAERQQEKLRHQLEVATMTTPVEKIDASIETDPVPVPRRRRAKTGDAGSSRLADPNVIIKVDAIAEPDPLIRGRRQSPMAKTQIRIEKQPVRLIMVSAPPKMVDVGTDAPKLRPKKKAPTTVPPVTAAQPDPLDPPVLPEPPAPPVPPKPPAPPKPAPPNPPNELLLESDIEEDNNSLYSSSTEEYDVDMLEPLTTKKIKIYKKRPDREVPISSDDTFEDSIQWFYKGDQTPSHLTASTLNNESDNPLSHEPSLGGLNLYRISSESSSEILSGESSYHSKEFSPSRVLTDTGVIPFSLTSGRAFIYMVIPPDGGYGWIILVLSFFAQLIVDGIVFSVGILLPYMSQEFNISNSQIIFVASIQMSCYFTGGAFSSVLINSYGFRPVAIVGVLLSATSILIASFSTNIWTMLVFYSLLGGPSLSMIWVSSQLIIGYYFERYRPIANGFSCSGAGAGVVLFNIMNYFLTLEVGWRYTLRVQVMVILLIIFMSMAYIEVSPTQVGVVYRDEYSSSSDEYYGNFYVHNFLREEESQKSPTTIEAYEPPMRSRGRRCWNMFTALCNRKKKRSSQNALSRRSSEKNFVVRPDPLQKDDLFYTGPVEYEEPRTREQLNGKDLELFGSEKYIQQAAYALRNIHEDRDKKAPSPPRYMDSGVVHRKSNEKSKCFHSKIFRALGRLFAVHLFSIFEFRLLILSAFLYPLGFNIPFVYSKARAEIPPNYAIMIGPAIGVTNFIVRIACGFLAYKVKSWTTYICGGGLVFGGFAVFISAFFGQNLIWFQLLYGFCYGVAPAVYSSLRALIYVRYLGLSNLTNTFGLSALAMGLGVFIGTSLGGVLLDNGGYSAAFALAGVCIMLSGLIKLLLPTIVKNRNRRLEQIGRGR